MRTFFFSIFFLISILGVCLSQPEHKPTFSLRIVDHSSGYLEPLFLQFKISNPENDLLVFPIYTSDWRPRLEYRPENSSVWVELDGSEYNPQIKHNDYINKINDPIPFIFPKGQTYEKTLVYPTTKGGDFSRDHLFKSPGVYFVRLKICPFFSDSSCFYSIEDTLIIQPYNGPDQRAMKLLKKTGVPNFIYEPFIADEFAALPDFTPQAKLLLKKFSNSTFAPWARFYIAFKTINNNIYNGKLEELFFAQTMVKEVLQDPDIENELLKKRARALLFDIEILIEINDQ